MASAIASAKSAPKVSAPSASVPVTGKNPSNVRLLSAGAEPRRALKYKFEKGLERQVVLSTRTKSTIRMGTRTLGDAAVPQLALTARIIVAEVKPTGTARLLMVSGRPSITNKSELPAAYVAQLDQALQTLGGIRGETVVDDHGHVVRSKLNTTQFKSAALRQTIESLQGPLSRMAAPFPQEPVGLGAKWEVTAMVKEQGMQMKQTVTHELVELDGDRGRLRVSVKQTAPSSSLHVPGLPATAKTELVGMTSSGRGDTRFDLRSPVPKGQVRTQATVKMKSKVGDKTERLTIEMNGLVKFKPVN